MAYHPNRIFSIVQKPGDVATNTLTVRARVRLVLEDLRAQSSSGLGNIEKSPDNSHRFRAVAPRA